MLWPMILCSGYKTIRCLSCLPSCNQMLLKFGLENTVSCTNQAGLQPCFQLQLLKGPPCRPPLNAALAHTCRNNAES